MNILDYTKRKNDLKLIYDCALCELNSFDSWKSYKSDRWVLSHVGINNDGSMVAVIRWLHVCKDQWVGVCWENISNRIKPYAQQKEE